MSLIPLHYHPAQFTQTKVLNTGEFNTRFNTRPLKYSASHLPARSFAPGPQCDTRDGSGQEATAGIWLSYVYGDGDIQVKVNRKTGPLSPLLTSSLARTRYIPSQQTVEDI